MSMLINGTQVDFQAAIINSSLTYVHFYEIQANTFGSDQQGDLSNINSTCDPNPCMNNGTCQILLGRKYNCLCTDGFIGTNIHTRD